MKFTFVKNAAQDADGRPIHELYGEKDGMIKKVGIVNVTDPKHPVYKQAVQSLNEAIEGII